MSNTPKPHPHAELIIAWAKGALIEYFDEGINDWEQTLFNQPTWDKDTKYRVKPEEPSNEAWKLIPGETYSFITSTGKVVLDANQNNAQDANRIAIGNCFPDSVANSL